MAHFCSQPLLQGTFLAPILLTQEIFGMSPTQLLPQRNLALMGWAHTRNETPLNQAGSGNARGRNFQPTCWGSVSRSEPAERPCPSPCFPSLSFLACQWKGCLRPAKAA